MKIIQAVHGERTAIFDTIAKIITPYSKMTASRHHVNQWRNRRGGAECPQRLLIGKFLLTYRDKRKKEARRKGVKIEKKRRKTVKGKVGKLKMEGGKVTK